LKYTTSEWIENYRGISGLNGRIFTSKQNENEIFIPAAGWRSGTAVYDVGLICDIWSSSLY